jgi:hypothetical protein
MVLRQIALRLKVTPLDDSPFNQLVVQDADTMKTLPLATADILLSLHLEAADQDTSYAHGYVRSMDDGTVYPIRTNRAMYDALCAYLGRAVERE